MVLNIKQRHHFVHKKYLEQWCKDGKLYCLDLSLSEPKQYLTSPSKKALEHGFHKIDNLDLKFLSWFISEKFPNVFPHPIEYMQTYCFLKELIHNTEILKAEPILNEGLKRYEYNFYENLHYDFEQTYTLISTILKNDNINLLRDIDNFRKFLLYFFIQYFRTRFIKNNLKSLIRKYDGVILELIKRHWYILSFYFSTDAFMYCALKPVLLKNCTKTLFITSEQPVIKIINDTIVKFYYPISPTRAILLDSTDSFHTDNINDSKAKFYNNLVMSVKGQTFGFHEFNEYPCSRK